MRGFLHLLWLIPFGLGLTSANLPPYLFWSGSASYIFLSAVYMRRHNCHMPRCWRFGKRAVMGTSLVYCHKHHPLRPGEAEA